MNNKQEMVSFFKKGWFFKVWRTAAFEEVEVDVDKWNEI